MLGRIVLGLVGLIVLGVALGLTQFTPLVAIGTLLFLTGGAILGFGLVLVLAWALDGLFFRGPDRWTRFN